MSQSTQTPGWGSPPTPQPPKRKRQFLVAKIAVGVAAGITLFIVGMIALAATLISGSSTGDTSAASPALTGQQQATTEPQAATPAPSDFTLTIKTLSKHCFGEAGCNITYRVELGYDGSSLAPDASYEITYEIRGVENGPQINTLTVNGGKYRADEEEFASTTSAAIKLKAVITDVSPI